MSTKITKQEDPMGVWPTVERIINSAAQQELIPLSETIKHDSSHLPDPDSFKVGTIFELPDYTLWKVVDDESRINDHGYRQLSRYENESGEFFAVVAP